MRIIVQRGKANGQWATQNSGMTLAVLVMTLVGYAKFRLSNVVPLSSNVVPLSSNVVPLSSNVIPAPPNVIPAQAGIQKALNYSMVPGHFATQNSGMTLAVFGDDVGCFWG